MLLLEEALGARSINEAIDKDLDDLLNAGLQLIWQTGKALCHQGQKERIGKQESVWVNEFITQMEYAYAAADIVVSVPAL